MLLKTGLIIIHLRSTVKKTNYIHFGIQNSIDLNNCKVITHTNSCIISNNKYNACNYIGLNRVYSTKYVGLYIDSNLKWDVHINYIKKIFKKIFYLYKSLRSILTFKLKKMTYSALIQSILSYGISFFWWGGTSLRNLEITLKSLLKFIFNKPSLFPAVKLYKELEILNLKTFYIKKTCIDVLFHNYNYMNEK